MSRRTRKDVSMGDLEDLDVEWDDLEEDNEEDQPGLGWMSRVDGQEVGESACGLGSKVRMSVG